VRYANAAGTERVGDIVGTDEVDLKRDHISWVSPRHAHDEGEAGDRVVLQAPSGTEFDRLENVLPAHSRGTIPRTTWSGVLGRPTPTPKTSGMGRLCVPAMNDILPFMGIVLHTAARSDFAG
jgi:hypothetical protein